MLGSRRRCLYRASGDRAEAHHRPEARCGAVSSNINNEQAEQAHLAYRVALAKRIIAKQSRTVSGGENNTV
jgi:hypothetical protein